VVRGFLDSVATLVGPLLAAVLLRFTDVAVVFGVASAASLAAAALLLGMRYDAPPRPAAPRGVHLVADAAEGICAIVRNRDLALFVGLGIAQTFTRGALTVFTVVVALDLLDIGEPGVGADVIGDGHLVTTLGPGEGFGEIALLRRVPRTAMVRAASDLELQALTCDRFLPIVTGFPPNSREAGVEEEEMLDRFSPGRPNDDQNGPRHSR
jgi:hypothetical protein